MGIKKNKVNSVIVTYRFGIAKRDVIFYFHSLHYARKFFINVNNERRALIEKTQDKTGFCYVNDLYQDILYYMRLERGFNGVEGIGFNLEQDILQNVYVNKIMGVDLYAINKAAINEVGKTD